MQRVNQIRNTLWFSKIKNSDLFETLKHSNFYFIAEIFTRGLAFIGIPIFTRLLTVEEYGLLAIFLSFSSITYIILSANLHRSVSRYYYENKSDTDEFIGTSLILVSLIIGFNILVFIIFFVPITNFLDLPGLLPVYLILTAIFTVGQGIYFQTLIPQKKSKEASLIVIVRGLVYLLLSVLLMLSIEDSRYLGRIWALLIVDFILNVYYTGKLISRVKFVFNKDHAKYILLYSIPLIPSSLSGVILAQFDRIMIGQTINVAAAGLYSLAYTVGSLLLLITVSTQKAIFPDFYKFMSSGEYKRLALLQKQRFSLILVGALGLILFSPEFLDIIVDKKFSEALPVIPIVVFGMIFYSMSFFYSVYITYEKKTLLMAIINLSAGLSNIILNIIFIPLYGYIAAAYTTAISYFLLFFLNWLTSRFVLKSKGIFPTKYLWMPTFLLILLLIFYSYLISFITLITLQFILKGLILLIFFVSLFSGEFWQILSNRGREN